MDIWKSVLGIFLTLKLTGQLSVKIWTSLWAETPPPTLSAHIFPNLRFRQCETLPPKPLGVYAVSDNSPPSTLLLSFPLICDESHPYLTHLSRVSVNPSLTLLTSKPRRMDEMIVIILRIGCYDQRSGCRNYKTYQEKCPQL